nr:MAG TPA_asm: hypothetical protein [Caudoviricetes sp.]
MKLENVKCLQHMTKEKGNLITILTVLLNNIR